MDNIFDKNNNFYCIGIKGAGMTALSEVLIKKGKYVSGSDIPERFFTDEVLQKSGIKVFINFNKKNIPEDTDVVIYSTAYTKANPEIKEAEKRGIPTISYPEALGELIHLFKKSVAISGTHGKTTVTALAGWMIERSGKDPTVIIGARSNNWRSNARVGSSDLIIFEADEYQDKFQSYNPHVTLVNNIEFDHPDYFKDIHIYKAAFSNFIKKTPKDGFTVANYDDIITRNVVQHAGVPTIWFGEDSLADWQLISRTILAEGGQIIKVARNGVIFGEFKMKLLGKHNAMNALGAMALAYKLGVNKDDLTDALASFQGTVRRLEVIGWVRDILIIDDYAHHPSEVKATLKSLKEAYPEKRIYTVFQPHTYSRTEEFKNEFIETLTLSDKVMLIDIFGSAREKKGNITSKDLAEEIRKYNKEVKTAKDTDTAISIIKDELVPGDLLLTMGAGETWKVAEAIHKLYG